MIRKAEKLHKEPVAEEALGMRLYHNRECESYAEHWHAGLEIIMTVKNGCVITAEGGCLEMEEGDIVIINSGILHELEMPPSGERLILQVDLSFLYNLKGMEFVLFLLQPLTRLPAGTVPAYRKVRERLERLAEEYDSGEVFRESLLGAYMTEILAEIGRGGVFFLRACAAVLPFGKAVVHAGSHEGVFLYQPALQRKSHA